MALPQAVGLEQAVASAQAPVWVQAAELALIPGLVHAVALALALGLVQAVALAQAPVSVQAAELGVVVLAVGLVSG